MLTAGIMNGGKEVNNNCNFRGFKEIQGLVSKIQAI